MSSFSFGNAFVSCSCCSKICSLVVGACLFEISDDVGYFLSYIFQFLSPTYIRYMKNIVMPSQFLSPTWVSSQLITKFSLRDTPSNVSKTRILRGLSLNSNGLRFSTSFRSSLDIAYIWNNKRAQFSVGTTNPPR